MKQPNQTAKLNVARRAIKSLEELLRRRDATIAGLKTVIGLKDEVIRKQRARLKARRWWRRLWLWARRRR